MKLKGVSLTQRREEARGRWHKHVLAQRTSGQTQVAYCRSRGLEPGHFSVWKRKFAEASAAASRSVRLVPLVVKAVPGPAESTVSMSEPVSMQLTLRNGLSVSLRIPSLGSIPVLLNELAELRC